MKVLCSIFSLLIIFSLSYQESNAEQIPEWVRNIALLYGQGDISENDFINAITFLIENDIISIDSKISKDNTMEKCLENELASIENVRLLILTDDLNTRSITTNDITYNEHILLDITSQVQYTVENDCILYINEIYSDERIIERIDLLVADALYNLEQYPTYSSEVQWYLEQIEGLSPYDKTIVISKIMKLEAKILLINS